MYLEEYLQDDDHPGIFNTCDYLDLKLDFEMHLI